jgi:GntR family transcriptional regulator
VSYLRFAVPQQPIDTDNGHGPVGYQAIATNLRKALQEGAYADGRRLPTEAELAESYGLSRQTVRRALQVLVSEGLVFRVRGRGTFATPRGRSRQYLRSIGSIEDLMALSIDTTLETIKPFQRLIAPDAAGRLQLDADEVYVGEFRRVHLDAPFSSSIVYLPPHIGRLVAAREPLQGNMTINGLVDELSPDKLAGAHQSITVAEVPADVAPQIDVEPGERVLRIDRLYFSQSGESLELAINHFNPRRYSYRLELRRVLPPGAA